MERVAIVITGINVLLTVVNVWANRHYARKRKESTQQLVRQGKEIMAHMEELARGRRGSP